AAPTVRAAHIAAVVTPARTAFSHADDSHAVPAHGAQVPKPEAWAKTQTAPTRAIAATGDSAKIVALSGSGLDVRSLLEACAGCDLSGKNLQNADLHGLRLEGDDMSDVDFRGANLRGTRFDGVDLSGARFDNADL